MKCSYCGGLVEWEYPIYEGNSKCEKCDSKNCQEIDNLEDDLEDEKE